MCTFKYRKKKSIKEAKLEKEKKEKKKTDGDKAKHEDSGNASKQVNSVVTSTSLFTQTNTALTFFLKIPKLPFC